MCRQFSDLRTWLMDDFGQDADTRANFLALVERGDLNGEAMSNGFAELAGELDGWLEEKRRMKAQLPAQAARPFGGRTWEEMEALVRRYEARTIGLNVFLLARDWRKAGESAKASPRPLRASADLLDAAIRSGDIRLFTELGRAIALLSRLEKGNRRTAFSYADWWKLHALVTVQQRHQFQCCFVRDQGRVHPIGRCRAAPILLSAKAVASCAITCRSGLNLPAATAFRPALTSLPVAPSFPEKFPPAPP